MPGTCDTAPIDRASIALHTALGFSADLHPDHAGPGADRVVFRLKL